MQSAVWHVSNGRRCQVIAWCSVFRTRTNDEDNNSFLNAIYQRGMDLLCVSPAAPARAPEIPWLIDPWWLTTGRHMRACYYANVVRHDIVLLEMILSNEAQQFLFSFLYYFIRCWMSPVGSRANRLRCWDPAPAPVDQIPNFLLACVSTLILIIIVYRGHGRQIKWIRTKRTKWINKSFISSGQQILCKMRRMSVSRGAAMFQEEALALMRGV